MPKKIFEIIFHSQVTEVYLILRSDLEKHACFFSIIIIYYYFSVKSFKRARLKLLTEK